MADTDVAEQLKALRAKLGISQAELARRLGVTPSTVARWESGLSMPRMRIETIAETASTRVMDAGLGAVLGGVIAGPAGSGMGAVLGLSLGRFLRNAGKLGLSVDQVADLLEDRDDSQPDNNANAGGGTGKKQ